MNYHTAYASWYNHVWPVRGQLEIDKMPVPTSQLIFSYDPVALPVISTNPSQAKPVGVGSVAEGGDTLSLQISLGQFTGLVDIYFAIYAPSIDPNNIYILNSDNYFQTTIVPWKENTQGPIDEKLFGDIPLSLLPPGTYYLYLAVTPADSLDYYYLWTTYFLIPEASTYKTAEYFPIAQGDTWTYKDEKGEQFTHTVSGTETINGVVATKGVKADWKGIDYWLFTSDDNGIFLYKEYYSEFSGWWSQSVYVPPFQRLPGEVSIGKTYTLEDLTKYYTDSTAASLTANISGEVTVMGIESITVTAGTFTNCLKLKFKGNLTSSDGRHTELSDFTDWYAKSVGLVKETGQTTNTNDGQVEIGPMYSELVSAKVGGVTYPH